MSKYSDFCDPVDEAGFAYNRHYYRKAPKKRKYKHEWKRVVLKVLNGERMDCPIGKWKFLVDECLRREFKISDEELSLILYLRCLNRAFTVDDVLLHAPTGMLKRSRNAVNSLKKRGFMKDFLGHNMNYNRKCSYVLTDKGLKVALKHVNYTLLISKMPLKPDEMGEDWGTRREDSSLKGLKKLNWYPCVMAFNSEVDARRRHDKLLKLRKRGEVIPVDENDPYADVDFSKPFDYFAPFKRDKKRNEASEMPGVETVYVDDVDEEYEDLDDIMDDDDDEENDN